MNFRYKKSRSRIREEGTLRDFRRFVIATEDTFAPNSYFRIFKNLRIQVVVLETEDGLSAPQHVIQRLDDYREKNELDDEDQLWLMLDTDHWVKPDHVANFRDVCARALQQGFRLAHCNPCFEIWLLLHLADLAVDDQLANCDQVVGRLRTELNGYNKRNADPAAFCAVANAQLAVQRAEKLDASPDDRWPQRTGTHVYRLVKELLSPGVQ